MLERIIPLFPADVFCVYRQRPDDSHAVDARPGVAGFHGDGLSDDADALHAAINHVQETSGEEIVFLAEGHYRLSHTIYLWSGIRLIGYGEHRPTLVLGDNTPGFEKGHDFLGTGRYVLQFASRRPAESGPIIDANEFTFYSGASNVDSRKCQQGVHRGGCLSAPRHSCN